MASAEMLQDLEKEITAFERLSPELEAHHHGKWVVIHDEVLVGAFDTLDAAAEEAATRFGRGPYLIRQVGAPAFAVPVSVMTWPAAS